MLNFIFCHAYLLLILFLEEKLKTKTTEGVRAVLFEYCMKLKYSCNITVFHKHLILLLV